jgi:hypothetical protein
MREEVVSGERSDRETIEVTGGFRAILVAAPRRGRARPPAAGRGIPRKMRTGRRVGVVGPVVRKRQKGVRKRMKAVLIAMSVLASTGCEAFVHGNGEYGEETRSVGAFDGVSVGLGIVGRVQVGAPTRSVTISGDTNVLQYIELKVVDGVLRTSLSGIDGFESVNQVQLVVATPQLVLARAWGDADLTLTDVDAAAFTVGASEGSSVALAAKSGATPTDLTLTATGTSAIDAQDFPVSNAAVTLSSSIATVTVTGALSGELSQGSSLVVYGGATCGGVTVAPDAVCQEL